MEKTEDRLEALLRRQAPWSDKQFGTPMERGPQGPLDHLADPEKGEAFEALTAAQALAKGVQDFRMKGVPTFQEVEALEQDLLEELADCVLLLLDANRRAGFTYTHLVDRCYDKMGRNERREWGEKRPQGAVFHTKEAPTTETEREAIGRLVQEATKEE